MRKIKGKVLLLSILAISLALSNPVTSYTTAKVTNSANINISSSEDALIATPEEIVLDLEKITTITEVETIRDNGAEIVGSINSNGSGDVLFDSMREYETETIVEISNKDFSFDIKNNMYDYINVVVFLDSGISIKDEGVKIKNSRLCIAPGKIEEVNLEVDETIESKTIDVLINVKWDGGAAEIKKSIDIEVNNIDYTDYKLVDLRNNIVALDSNNIVKDINEAEEQTEPAQKEPVIVESEQIESEQAEPGQAELGQPEPGQTEPGQTEPEQTKPVQEELKQDVPEQEDTKQIELSEIISETDEESNSN